MLLPIASQRHDSLGNAAHPRGGGATLRPAFTGPEPDAGGDFKSFLNPKSLEIVTAKASRRWDANRNCVINLSVLGYSRSIRIAIGSRL